MRLITEKKWNDMVRVRTKRRKRDKGDISKVGIRGPVLRAIAYLK